MQAARECRRQAQGWRQALAVHGATLPSGSWTDAASRDAGLLVQSGPRGHRAAPGIEPGTSRTLSENHATRPSSHVVLLASTFSASATLASVGHLRDLRNRGLGIRWRHKLPGNAPVDFRDGPGPGSPWFPVVPVGSGRLPRVETLGRWCNPAQGPRGLLRELNPGPLAP